MAAYEDGEHPSALTARRSRLSAFLSSPGMPPAAIALIALAVFAPACWNGFVWDDEINLVGNVHYRGLGWSHLRWMLTTGTMGHWIPLTWLSFGLDYLMWGMNPAGYHLTNILLHATAAAAFYFVALRLLRAAMPLTGEATLRLGAATAALFFALHPLRTESVAWTTERRDVLSGLLFFVTVLTYLRACESEGAGRRGWLAGSVASYALALASKSIVMTLPLVLIVLDIYPLRRTGGGWRGRIAEKLAYFALAIAGASIASSMARVPALIQDKPLSVRLAISAYSHWFYLWKTVFPLGLSPLYELPARVSLLDPPFLSSALAVVAITTGLWLLRRRWPAGLAIWAIYALMLAPVSGLVHAGPQLVANRYSYLSCLGWALLIGAGVCVAVRAGTGGALRSSYARLPVIAATLWIAGLAGLSLDQIRVWRDTDTLWRSALDADPRCDFCHANLGAALEKRGLYGAAIEHFETALALRPDSTLPRRNLALTLLRAGRPAEADAELRRLVAAAPVDADLRNYLGVALIREGRLEEAVEQLQRAVRVNPGHAEALTNLGTTLATLDRPAEALPILRKAIAITPGDARLRDALRRLDRP